LRNLIQRNAINFVPLATEVGIVYEDEPPQARSARVADLIKAVGIDGRRSA
jgi:hypothetical protein